MKEKLRRFSFAAAGFAALALAAVGVACGVSPWSTTIRSMLGAAIVYLVVRTAIELAVRVLIEDRQPETEESAGDS